LHVQRSGDIGSPRASGSTSAFRSWSNRLSVSTSDFRPPSGRRRDQRVRDRPNRAAARPSPPCLPRAGVKRRPPSRQRSPWPFPKQFSACPKGGTDRWISRRAHSLCQRAASPFRCRRRRRPCRRRRRRVGHLPQFSFDHRERQCRLGRKAARRAVDQLSRNMRLGHTRFILGPAFGQIKLAVDEGMAALWRSRRKRRSGSS
jgi:hypothetical protein